MKHTIVPAQITTVEDRITGNLTLNQLLLLSAPIFIDFALYAILPKGMNLNSYKFVLMMVITGICCLSAVRIKGRILLIWAITIARFNLRPQYYIFNKNDNYLRLKNTRPSTHETEEINLVDIRVENQLNPKIGISDEEVFRLNGILDNPSLKFSYLSHKKAGLRVYISEVE